MTDMKEQILSNLCAECPWGDTLHWYSSIDSTNTQAKLLARQGAPHGTVLVADHQTGGRGRMGRAFQSPEGMGIYLSVILRPNCSPRELMHLTCAAAVAAGDAVSRVCGLIPQVKWINDLVVGNRKLGGILTELSMDGQRVEYAVVGIGINCLQTPEDLPSEIADLATSVRIASGAPVSRPRLAAALVEALWQMSRKLLPEKAPLMEVYRQRCVTLGREIQVLRADTVRPGKALALDEDGGLLVEYPDGTREIVSSGEVSVRGMYGYV